MPGFPPRTFAPRPDRRCCTFAFAPPAVGCGVLFAPAGSPSPHPATRSSRETIGTARLPGGHNRRRRRPTSACQPRTTG
jgi:hypothetical protein